MIATDIVSYSQEYDEGQIAAVTALSSVISNTAATFGHDDVILLPTGDGVIVVLLRATATDALEFATAMQTTISDRSLRLPLRIGIHEGTGYLVQDVQGARNIVGHVVNIAARVMDIGDAGHILVSQTAFESLRNVGRVAASLRPLESNPVSVKHGVALNLYNYVDGALGRSAQPGKVQIVTGVRSTRIGRELKWKEMIETREHLRIIGNSVPSFGDPEFLDALEHMLIKQEVQVQVLLLSPVSATIVSRSESRAYDSASELLDTLEYVIKILRGFRNRLRAKSQMAADRFQVKLFHVAPTFTAFITDERAYVNIYVEHVSGSRGPFMELDRRSGTHSFYRMFDEAFSEIWRGRSDDLFSPEIGEKLRRRAVRLSSEVSRSVVPDYI